MCILCQARDPSIEHYGTHGAENLHGGDVSLSAAKPVYTYDQIADYLTTGFWSDFGIVARNFDVEAGGTITYNLDGLTSYGAATARNALDAWTAVSGLQFQADAATAAQMTFDDNNSGAYATWSSTGGHIVEATINVHSSWANYGAYYYQTFMHEIGHALGLGHTGSYNGSADYAADAEYANDSWQTSVMSYFSQSENTWTNASQMYLATLQLGDIAAIQKLYGTPTNVEAGDTVYGDGESTGGRFGMDLAGNSAVAIVDSGGIDVIDLGSRGFSQYVSLVEETYSNINGWIGNFSIGRSTVIENVITGSGNDHIVGNAVSNRVESGAGNDTLIGGASADILSGGYGNDMFVMRPGDGADTIIDFERGTGPSDGDKIDVGAYRYAFSQIGFEAETGGLRVRLGGDSILLQNLALSRLDPSDFVGLAGSDVTLSVGVIDGGSYGNLWQGLGDTDGRLTASFAGGNASLVFSLTGYDVDFVDEIEVLINGASLGYLGAGVDNGTSYHEITIDAAEQIDGENVLTLVQKNPAWMWGVTDLLISDGPPVDAPLSVGVMDAGSYGNRWKGLSDSDGRLTASFAGGTDPLVLSLTGYDIDFADELEVLLNGTSLGYLGAGVDNGMSYHEITIDAADQIDGENVLTLQQKNPAWMWGVTDLLISDGPPVDVALSVGMMDGGNYGNRWQGLGDTDGRLTVSFAGGTDPLVFSLTGYDIDFADELEVLLNGTSLGYLGAGVDNGMSYHEITIDLADQVAGENVLTLVQKNPAWMWGVTDLLISDGPPVDVALSVGVMDPGSYGNRWKGLTDADGRFAASFEGGTDSFIFSLTGYDIDFADEIEVLLNGAFLGYLDAGVDNGTSYHEMVIDAADQIDGENVLTLLQKNAAWAWGVTDLLIEA